MPQLRRHIALHEVVCPCGECEPVLNDSFLDKVEAARVIADIPFVFSSFERCPTYNKKVGGADNSPHPLGLGCDVKTGGNRSRARKIVNAAVIVGFEAIEIATRHIHLDNMKRAQGPVLWPAISK